MRLLIYLGHPAHFHLFKNSLIRLKERGHEIKILIKKKDVLEPLLVDAGWEYINILPQGRKNDKLAIALGLGKREVALWQFTRHWRPQLMVGTSAEIAHIGRLRGISSLVVNEDDWDVVPLFSRMVYPFCDRILAPDCCRVGRWQDKTIPYAGYHELAYLHPNYFTPDERVGRALKRGQPRYFILRFAQLTAHHDHGVRGLSADLVKKLINRLEPHGMVYITSERSLEPQWEPYRIPIPPLDMHQALAFADLFIGDSQTMAAEAAVLGIPALRLNDFVGRISYLDQLEERFQLAFGFRPEQEDDLIATVDTLLAMPQRRDLWQARRANMLAEKIDVTAFMVDLFERLAVDNSNREKLGLNI